MFALWGGAIADSMDRRKLLLLTHTGIAVTSLLFWGPGLGRTGVRVDADAAARPGALVPVIGLAELYLIDALALCVTVGAVYRLPALPPLTPAKAGSAGLRGVLEGFRCISGHAVLLLSFLADIVAMVLGMPRALFPQVASETYAPYGEGFAPGLLFAAIPLGAVLGGLFSGTFSRARRHGWMVIGSVVV